MLVDKKVDPAPLRAFVIDTFLFGDGSGLQDDVSFMETGLIDSTGILEVVEFVEETYGIKVRDEQLIPDNLDSIERIARFIGSFSES
jgi:acyl carrier protein